MKCEICNKQDAQTAINVEENGETRELYVCRECAKRERIRRLNKSQRTRKQKNPSSDRPEIVSLNGDEEVPPFVEALVNAVSDFVGDLERARKESAAKASDEMKMLEFSGVRKGGDAYHIRGHLHLEGLHLIGELEAVRRAMHALDMRLVGISADGVFDTGHAFKIEFSGAEDVARRVEHDLLEQERFARIRLFEEMPRVFGDSLCRALAILKNCRLLSPGELFDLLSPLRLATYEGMLDGLSTRQVNKMMEDMDLTSSADALSADQRDKEDAARADATNERFEDVVLNDCAEGKFL